MARSIQDGSNVNAPTAEYPDGNTRDKAGVTPGTIPNEAINGDGQQLFAKLMRDAAIVANGDPDNETNTYQLMLALVAKIRATTSTTTAAGTTEKATDAESLSGEAGKNITADLMQSETALKAALAVVLAGTVSNQFITPEGLAAKDGGLIKKVIDIGDWDMDADGSIDVPHGIGDFTKIKEIYVMIRNDQGTSLVPLIGGSSIGAAINEGGTTNSIGATNISLGRVTGGLFDSTSYDSTSYNRGWMTIYYLP